jgi:hypothetical protein
VLKGLVTFGLTRRPIILLLLLAFIVAGALAHAIGTASERFT